MGGFVEGEIEDDQWYHTFIESNDFAIEVVSPKGPGLEQVLKRLARETGPDLGPPLVIETVALPPSAWSLASYPFALVDRRVREVLESEARPGDLRWLDTRIVTAGGVSDDYSIPMPAGQDRDVYHEESMFHTDFGLVMGTAFDARKVADLSVIYRRDMLATGLAVRGRVLKRVLVFSENVFKLIAVSERE